LGHSGRCRLLHSVRHRKLQLYLSKVIWYQREGSPVILGLLNRHMTFTNTFCVQYYRFAVAAVCMIPTLVPLLIFGAIALSAAKCKKRRSCRRNNSSPPVTRTTSVIDLDLDQDQSSNTRDEPRPESGATETPPPSYETVTSPVTSPPAYDDIDHQQLIEQSPC